MHNLLAIVQVVAIPMLLDVSQRKAPVGKSKQDFCWVCLLLTALDLQHLVRAAVFDVAKRWGPSSTHASMMSQACGCFGSTVRHCFWLQAGTAECSSGGADQEAAAAAAQHAETAADCTGKGD